MATLGIIWGLITLVINAVAYTRPHDPGMEYFAFNQYPHERPYLYATQVVLTILGLVVNSCLLYGVLKLKHKFILVWVIVAMIEMVLLALAFLVYVIILFTVNVTVALVTLVVGAPLLGLCYYFWLVVRSADYEVKEATSEAVLQPKEQTHPRQFVKLEVPPMAETPPYFP